MLVEIERFVNWVHRRNSEARTWRDYGYDLHFFMEVVGDRPPNEVKFQDVDRFVILQRERGFKASTINRRLAAVMALYTFLSDEDNDLVCPVLPHRHHLREPVALSVVGIGVHAIEGGQAVDGIIGIGVRAICQQVAVRVPGVGHTVQVREAVGDVVVVGICT